jgi:hypothetical protein
MFVLIIARMRAVDFTGRVFGRWTVIGPRCIRRSIPIWLCRCSCGSEKWVVSQTLRNGRSRSCGCLLRQAATKRFLKDLAGQKFGRLKVLHQRKTERRINFWLCRCDCGNAVWVRANGLREGSSKSCGCLSRELSSQRARLRKRHRVVLTKAQREKLQQIGDIDSRILLLSDAGEAGSDLTDQQISERLNVSRMKVDYVRTKFAAPHEIRRRAVFALQQMKRDPRRNELRIEARRRYDAKPTSKAKKLEYRKNMPEHLREHKRIYTKAYKRRLEVRLRENQRERAWRQTPEGKKRKRLYVERGKQRSNARWRERYATEVTFRIRHALRARLRLALNRRGIVEPRRTIELVGCTAAELRHHFERQFLPGMSWENHGEWHIDHIIPCAKFDLSDPEALAQCFHFSNLQPLWAAENVRKGGRLQWTEQND